MLNISRTLPVRMLPRWSRDSLILSATLLVLLSLMLVFIVAPLVAMLAKSVQNAQGEFVGLTYFAQYFASTALWQSMRNTLVLGIGVTAAVGLLAFGYAYALTRSCIPGKSLFR
ncbi:putative 2-aminoethylphosphonate ABC transporter permease subunit, partial [Vibrio mimicus]